MTTQTKATAAKAATKPATPRKAPTKRKASTKRQTPAKAASKVPEQYPACLAAEADYPSGNTVRRTFTAACALVANLIRVSKAGTVTAGTINRANVDLFQAMVNGRAKPFARKAWIDAEGNPIKHADGQGPVAKLSRSAAGKHAAGYQANLDLLHEIAGYLKAGKAGRYTIKDPTSGGSQTLILSTHPRSGK